jgi:hypothetical protein
VIDYDSDVIVTIPRGSSEPIIARLKSPTGEILNALNVKVSANTVETTYSWVAAQWADGTPDSERVVEATTATTWNTPGDYYVHVMLDNAQIIRCSNKIRVP